MIIEEIALELTKLYFYFEQQDTIPSKSEIEDVYWYFFCKLIEGKGE